jgi:cytochrome c-type biogenesis protein CcmH
MRLLFIALFFGWSLNVNAVIETYEFETPELRARYHVFVEELRCPKCQNQNLADSNAGVAADLRREVHRLLHDGLSDQEIYDFMVARYGEFVLYRPKTSGVTLYLWLAPHLMLVLALVVVMLIVKRSQQTSHKETLDNNDQVALQKVLEGIEQQGDKS